MATDDKFAFPAAVTISSLMANLASDVAVDAFVIGYGLGAANRRLLEGLGDGGSRLSVRLFDRDQSEFTDYPASSPGHNRITKATYGRLVFPDIVPASVDRLLYLDADTLVRHDVSSLYQMDLTGHAIGARHDPVVPTFDHPGGVQAWRTLDVSGQTEYFNSGVMVLDIERWHAEDWGPRVKTYLMDHRDNIMLFDQEGLNAVARGSFARLDWQWNAIEYRRKGDITTPPDPMLDAYIVHFLGDVKPWDLPAGSSDGACHSEYWQYAEKLTHAE
ncbi:glycosyltransferase family 8 protein [Actinoplanes sp. CA-054009]